MSLVCFDIDGTLAKIDHRLGFIRSKPKNWPAFNAGIPNDLVNEPVAKIYRHFALSPYSDATVILASGRSEEVRSLTEDWLRSNGLTGYQKLYMRKSKDYRSDDIVKDEIIDQIFEDFDKLPDLWFDDRPRVVRAVRKRGIFVFDVYQGEEDF